MRRCPCTLLVWFVFSIFCFASSTQAAGDYLNVVVQPDTLSPLNSYSLGADSQSAMQPVAVPASAFSYGAPLRAPTKEGKAITKCAPQPAVFQQPYCPPPLPGCILPKRLPGQFELGTQVFWAKTRGVVRWPATVMGMATSDADPHSDLGLPIHNVFLEYSGKFQFRPTWAVFYSIMPIQLEGNATTPRTIYYGGLFYPAGSRVNTKWDFVYQKVALLYQPILTCNASLSIYAGWMFNDQKLSLKSGVCGGQCCTLNRTRNTVVTGAELQKCIKTMCNGATLSCDSRADLTFVDDTFGYDVQAGLRFSVPMGANRWGYAKGGYRLLNLNEDRNDLRLDLSMEGGFVEGGLLF